MLVHGGAEGLLFCFQVADPGRLAVPLVGDQVQVLTVSGDGRGRLGRAQRLDLLVRVAAAIASWRDRAVACSQSCRSAIDWA